MARRTITPLALSVILIAALAGCAPADDDAGPTSTMPSTPLPTHTGIEDGLPPEARTLTDDARLALVERCYLESQESAPATATESAHWDEARVERREVDPGWLVYLPTGDSEAEQEAHSGGYLCLFSGGPGAFVTESVGGDVSLTDDEIQQRLSSNDGFDL